jgi:nucleoside-diphosphate-sugar epimerase
MIGHGNGVCQEIGCILSMPAYAILMLSRTDWNSAPKHSLRLFKNNAIGTVTVLVGARAAGVDNIVFTSSAGVYGNVVEAEEYGPVHPS